VKTLKHRIFDFFKKKGIVCWNVLNTMWPRSKIGWKTSDILSKNGEKVGKKSIFCVKFDLVRGGARLHFIAKRLDRPSFLIKRSHFSNIRVKSEGVVATAWWVGVEWPHEKHVYTRTHRSNKNKSALSYSGTCSAPTFKIYFGGHTKQGILLECQLTPIHINKFPDEFPGISPIPILALILNFSDNHSQLIIAVSNSKEARIIVHLQRSIISRHFYSNRGFPRHFPDNLIPPRHSRIYLIFRSFGNPA